MEDPIVATGPDKALIPGQVRAFEQSRIATRVQFAFHHRDLDLHLGQELARSLRDLIAWTQNSLVARYGQLAGQHLACNLVGSLEDLAVATNPGAIHGTLDSLRCEATGYSLRPLITRTIEVLLRGATSSADPSADVDRNAFLATLQRVALSPGKRFDDDREVLSSVVRRAGSSMDWSSIDSIRGRLVGAGSSSELAQGIVRANQAEVQEALVPLIEVAGKSEMARRQIVARLLRSAVSWPEALQARWREWIESHCAADPIALARERSPVPQGNPGGDDPIPPSGSGYGKKTPGASKRTPISWDMKQRRLRADWYGTRRAEGHAVPLMDQVSDRLPSNSPSPAKAAEEAEDRELLLRQLEARLAKLSSAERLALQHYAEIGSKSEAARRAWPKVEEGTALQRFKRALKKVSAGAQEA